MDEVRIGVIGVGNVGFMHAANLYQKRVQGAVLKAVCDIRKRRLALCTERFPEVSCYLHYRELLRSGEVDAVVVAVPHRMHSRIAGDALRAGLHVLVEKPLDVSITQAGELIRTAKESGCVFAVMLNQRTSPLFQRAREIVQGGLLGELKRSVWIVTNWYRTQHYYDSGDWRALWRGEGGGVLLNQAPHNLDLWQWICGMPVSVTAFCNVAKYHRIEVEDEATIYTKYKNGATGLFVTTTGEYPGTNRLEISGNRGKLVLENSRLCWWQLEESERDICYRSQEDFPEIGCDYQEFALTERESGHVEILQNFANAVRLGERLLSPGEDGLNELTISNAAYLSEWTGNREIRLPFDSREFDRRLAERSARSPVKRQAAEDGKEDGQKRWQVRW